MAKIGATDYCSNGLTWSKADEKRFLAERERNRREWGAFSKLGALPYWCDSNETFSHLAVVMYDNSELRSAGVPIIHNVDHDGTVTITAGFDDLRRVVIQPAGEIVMELATKEVALDFVRKFNARHLRKFKASRPRQGSFAEAIDYKEVYLRARAAGF